MFAASLAEAQQPLQSCGSAPTLVTGEVRDAQTRAPIGGRGVTVSDSSRMVCTSIADSIGKFRFEGLPPGRYSLSTGEYGYRALGPIPFRIGTADTMRLSVQLVPGSHFDDCLDAPACAAWLDARQLPGGTDKEQFEFAALRTAAILTWKALDKPLQHYFCFDAGDSVVAAFRRVYSKVAPRGECQVTQERSDARDGLRHIPTGEAAYALGVTEGSARGPDTRTADLGFYVAPLWAEGWSCDFERHRDGWRPVSCRMDWIS
jgi:hypothetical protein